MRKKLITLFTGLSLLLAQAMPAFADITTFGYNHERRRLGNVDGSLIEPLAVHDFVGPSLSQPLLLDGAKWGMNGQTLAVTVEGNMVYGYVLPEVKDQLGFPPERLQAAWSTGLQGSRSTDSHPTLVEAGGKKYIYIGTSGPYFEILDITDFWRPEIYHKPLDPQEVTDIVSAPLIMDWQGHQVVVFTTGNTAKVGLMIDPFGDQKFAYINTGAYGRTSSSPAPLSGNRFAIGIDQGPNKGQLRIYDLDTLLTEDSNGQVVHVSNNAEKVAALPAGLVASFSVDNDILYFGDCQSNVYAYDANAREFAWINQQNAGTFSNRSPALANGTVYFPATGRSGDNGKVIAVDQNTGRTRWAADLIGKGQSSPIVMNSYAGLFVVQGAAGNADTYPYLAVIDDATGKVRYNAPMLSAAGGYMDPGAGGSTSGDLGAMGKYLIASLESGVSLWSLVHSLDLSVSDLTTGIPEGVQAKPGETYRGSFRVSLKAIGEMPLGIRTVGFTILINGKPLPPEQIQIEGAPLATARRDSGKTFPALTDIRDGDTLEGAFEWTVPEVASTITAIVNLNEGNIIRIWNEDRYDNNKQVVKAAILAHDLEARFVGRPAAVTAGKPQPLTMRFHNHSTVDVDTTARLSIAGKVVQNFDLTIPAGGYVDKSYSFTPPTGLARVQAMTEVNPGKDRPEGETTWENNRDPLDMQVLAEIGADPGNLKGRLLETGQDDGDGEGVSSYNTIRR